ncbi:response regulator [Glaciecola sp. 2405UD65-10]|jgi:CheY-like chemotaxis protein|uniref:response regulator n=1 Tax=Glaciecola sp. 2405UD65-10 TaxID=3397244 RepID=UPI003B5936DA
MKNRNTIQTPFTIIMADDDEDDRLLAQDAMEAAGANYLCHTVADGQELLDFLRCEGKYESNAINDVPSVILLDLNMPILDGRETLKQLKKDDKLSSIPVVILSTSSADEDVHEGYLLGASSYMVKPTDFGSLVNMMKSFNNYWFECAAIPHFSARELATN